MGPRAKIQYCFWNVEFYVDSWEMAVDLLDSTANGEQRFGAALKAYDQCINGIKKLLTKLLRNKLTGAEVTLFLMGSVSVSSNRKSWVPAEIGRFVMY